MISKLRAKVGKRTFFPLRKEAIERLKEVLVGKLIKRKMEVDNATILPHKTS